MYLPIDKTTCTSDFTFSQALIFINKINIKGNSNMSWKSQVLRC